MKRQSRIIAKAFQSDQQLQDDPRFPLQPRPFAHMLSLFQSQRWKLHPGCKN